MAGRRQTREYTAPLLAMLLAAGCAHRQQSDIPATLRQHQSIRPLFGDFAIGEHLTDLETAHPNLRLLNDPAVTVWNDENRYTSDTEGFPTVESRNAGGIAIMAIYYTKAPEGFTNALALPSTDAHVAPFFIQVCAEYQGYSSIPNSVHRDATLCGIYGTHTTDPRETSINRIIPNDHASYQNAPMYLRVLEAIRALDGDPFDYHPRAHITIVPPPPDAANVDQPKPISYHWNDGKTALSFSYNPRTRTGTLWHYNSLARDFVKHRHDLGDDEFYKLLPGYSPSDQRRWWGTGAGSLCRVDCAPKRVPTDPRLRAQLEPHRG